MKLILKIILSCLLFSMLPLFSLYSQENSLTQEVSENPSSSKQKKTTPADMGLRTQIFRRIGVDNSVPLLIKNLGAMKDYQLTPGDIYRLAIKGGDLTSIDSGNPIFYDIQLLSNYTIELPLIGTINCRNKGFQTLQKEVINKIKSAFSVFYVNFTFSQPAEFNLFVYGSVKNPGRVQATPLMTLAQALSNRGGFMADGSYRRVELRRNGKVNYIDLSKYYTDADISQNPYVQPGDIIFVPVATVLIEINGSVRKPGTYEVLEDESVNDLIKASGGLSNDASTQTFEIERHQGYSGERVYINYELEKSNTLFPKNRDKIYIRSIFENGTVLMVDGAIYGQRHIQRAIENPPMMPLKINLPYYSGASALSLLDAVGGPTPFAIYEDAFIKRRGALNKEPFALRELWETRNPDLDVALHPGDILVIPMQLLKIFVGGEVNRPGGFDFSNSYRALDYVMMAGGYNNTADMSHLFKLDSKGKPIRINLDDKLEPGTIVYVRKDHAAEAAKILQNITVYTNFIGSILGTINSGVYAYRQFEQAGIVVK